MSADFKVRRGYQDEIADEAFRWRSLDPKTVGSSYFDVIAFLVDFVLPTLAAAGQHISYEIIEDDYASDLAWVDFGKKVLFVQRHVWASAQRNDPYGRLIIAHEIGHLVLHRSQVLAFSKGLEAKLNFLDPSESAECQANWFATALLLPTELVLRHRHLPASALATLTLVGDRVAATRLEQVRHDKRYRGEMTGDSCPNCSNFTLFRDGAEVRCQCGYSASD